MLPNKFLKLSMLILLVGLGACGEEQSDDVVQTQTNAQIVHDCRRILPPLTQTGSGAKGSVSINFSNFIMNFSNNRYNYRHERKFREIGGVGGFFYRGRVCVENGTECVDACVRLRVDAGSTLEQKSHHFSTALKQDKVSVEYWFRDDNGNLDKLLYTIHTNGNQFQIFD
ncbi:MAG: hypothetical protein AB8B77_01855 [Alphaproteobacteria bacterium]